jgi:fructokinase
MILVAGESLIDLIVEPHGGVHARPGGGPFNSARTIGRLGHPTRFIGRLSTDPFGQLLRDRLARDRVEAVPAGPAEAPTALAIVTVSAAGVPRYWFHLAGTAGFLLDGPAAHHEIGDEVSALHVGTLGLVVEPMATGLEHLVTTLPGSALLLLDPNCRPQATPDPDGYRARIRRLLRRTDIAKTSTEDLAYLLPGTTIPDAARTLQDWGASCVLVTDGPALIRAFAGDEQIAVPVPPVEVVDTIGAGDAFGGAFLTWWTEQGLTRENLTSPGLLRAAVAAAARVASLTCGKAGAEPPWRHELDATPEWGQLPVPQQDPPFHDLRDVP